LEISIHVPGRRAVVSGVGDLLVEGFQRRRYSKRYVVDDKCADEAV
jgi:hypothetical protein